MIWMGLCYHMLLTTYCCLTTGPKATGPMNHIQNSETMNWNKPLFISWLFHLFVIVMESQHKGIQEFPNTDPILKGHTIWWRSVAYQHNFQPEGHHGRQVYGHINPWAPGPSLCLALSNLAYWPNGPWRLTLSTCAVEWRQGRKQHTVELERLHSLKNQSALPTLRHPKHCAERGHAGSQMSSRTLQSSNPWRGDTTGGRSFSLHLAPAEVPGSTDFGNERSSTSHCWGTTRVSFWEHLRMWTL
jgi:hypothetical protein